MSRGVPREGDEESALADFAELILAVARLIRPPADLDPPMCTPVESSVMRFIDRSPGSSARAVADAVSLPTSNFARVLRGLEKKGLVRREADIHDARSVRLHPTDLARKNKRRMQDTWAQALKGTVDDLQGLEALNASLRQVEERLASR